MAATTGIAAASSAAESETEGGSLEAASFVGRREALSRLRRAWNAACSGKRTVVWVTGEAGIGKTTLIERFIAGLGEVACAHGQCVEQYGPGEPYLPVLDALGELCRGDSTVAPLLRAVAPAWLVQLPWLSTAEERDALHRELAGVGADRMLREMGEFFDRYTRERPLLLVTEDLHWSDHATIQLINHFARRRGSAHLMWIGSFRLAEIVANDHPLKALRNELRLHGLCEEVVLDEFSEQEVSDYVAQRAPSVAGDDAFVRALHERTDGLPLFVAYVMNEIAARTAQGGVDASALALLEKMAMPENLAAVIDRYVDLLGTEQRALLSAAAVCGVDFRARTVAYALDRDAAAVDEACGQLAHEQLWLVALRPEGGSDATDLPYSFRHALVRQVLYECIGPLARAELHRKVGRALERERTAGASVAPAELAMHFERGREPLVAMRYYAEAAEAAFAHLSPTECLALSERGLSLAEHAPDGAERKALEITLATLQGLSNAHLRGVSSNEAKSALQRAYSLLGDVPEHPKRSLLLHGFGFVLCMRAEYGEALELAARAEALSSAANDPLLLLGASTVHAEVHMLQGRPRAALEWTERGLAVIASLAAGLPQGYLGDPRVTLLGLSAIQQLHIGLVRTARARLEEACARARQLAQPMAQLVAIWCYALFEIRLGNVGHVAALADEMRGLVDEFALAQGRTACRWFRGWADARMGEPHAGHRRIREAYEESTRLGMLAGGSETMGYAAEALLIAGAHDAAQRELEQALEIAHARNERVYLPQLLLFEGAIARARGQSDISQASVRHAVDEARAQEAPWLELLALTELCERKHATDEDRNALAALVDQLPEAAETSVVTKARALLHRAKRP